MPPPLDHWLSRSDFTLSDYLSSDMMNNLANDIRYWGGNVNGGGYILSNVILEGSGGFQYTASPITLTQGGDGETRLELRQGTGAASLLRWALTKDATAETGANAGSNFNLNRYNDAGAFLGTPFSINRATGLITMGAQHWTGPIDGGGQTITNVVIPGVSGQVSSVFTRVGAVAAAAGDYTAAQVTNAVSTQGSYADPAWITSLAWAKITGAPAAAVSSVFTRTGAVAAQSGDYTAAQVTNAVSTQGSYADPIWLTSLAWAKITGAPVATTATYYVNGTFVASRPTLNLIAGTGTILSGSVDQSGPSRVDITVTATGAGGGLPQSPWASDINAAGFTLRGAGRIGAGVTAPDSRLMLSNNAAAPPVPVAGTIAHLAGADGDATRILLDSFGSSSNFTMRSSGGTAAASTALASGAVLGTLAFQGYGATGYSATARGSISATAAENWSDTAQGTVMVFYTTPIGSTSAAERMRIAADGKLGIGMTPAYPLDVTGDCNITGSYRINGVPISSLGGGGGSQTPWTSDIVAANYFLHRVKGIGIGATNNASDGFGILVDSLTVYDGFKQMSPSPNGWAGFSLQNDAGTTLSFRVYGSTRATPNIAKLESSGGFTFDTAAAERMRITTGGLVGIGCIPQVTLHIKAGSEPIRLETTADVSTGGAQYVSFYDSVGREAYIGFGGASNVFTFNLDGGGKTFKFQNGNVGIGKVAGAYALDIVGDCNITGTFRVNGAPLSTGGNQTPWTSDIDAAQHKLLNASLIQAISATPGYQVQIGLTGAVSHTYGLAVSSGDGTFLLDDITNGVTRLCIAPSTGYTGIGLTGPLTKLHVAADVSRQLYLTSSSDPVNKQMRIGYDTSNNTVVVEGLLNGAGVALKLNPTGGFVGINCASPQSALEIAGMCRCTGSQSPSIGAGLEMHYNAPLNLGTVIAYGRDGTGAKALHLGSDGNSGIRIAPSGYVGINTTTGYSKLSFGAADATCLSRIAFYEAGGGIYFRGIGMTNPAAGVYGVGIWASITPTDTNMHMFVKDGGNVGFGSVSPTTLISTGTTLAPIKISTYDGGPTSCFGIGVMSGVLTFGAGIDPAAGVPQMVLHASGFLGINCAGPSALLSVNAIGTPQSIATANQISIGESSNAGGYKFNLGYAYNIGSNAVWAGVLQSLNAGAASPLYINASGGGVVMGLAVAPHSGSALTIFTGSPGTIAASNQIFIGESSNNASYGLNIGFGAFQANYGWAGCIQANCGGGTGTLSLNPAGGPVVIGATVGNTAIPGTCVNSSLGVYQTTNVWVVLGLDPGAYAANPVTGIGMYYDATNSVGRLEGLSGGIAWRGWTTCINGGNFGIGTAAPAYKLDVTGTAFISGAVGIYGAPNAQSIFEVQGISKWATFSCNTAGAMPPNYSAVFLGWNHSNGSAEACIAFNGSTTGLIFADTYGNTWKERVRFSANGNVGIQGNPTSYQLQMFNDSAGKPGTNTWAVVSDLRTKRDIRPFTVGLETLIKLIPISYKYNGEAQTPDGLEAVGVVAQEVEDIIPTCVHRKPGLIGGKEDEVYGVNTGDMTWMMVNALREIDERLRKLEAVTKN